MKRVLNVAGPELFHFAQSHISHEKKKKRNLSCSKTKSHHQSGRKNPFHRHCFSSLDSFVYIPVSYSDPIRNQKSPSQKGKSNSETVPEGRMQIKQGRGKPEKMWNLNRFWWSRNREQEKTVRITDLLLANKQWLLHKLLKVSKDLMSNTGFKPRCVHEKSSWFSWSLSSFPIPAWWDHCHEHKMLCGGITAVY